MNELEQNTADAGSSTDIAESEAFEATASFAQQRLWFMDQLDPGSAAYNINFSVRLTGELDTQCLQLALNDLVDRHESLRTTFEIVEEKPVQVISDTGQIELLSGLSISGNAELQATLARLSAQSFDLEYGPLLNAHLLNCGQHDHVLLLTMHHIIADAWSLEVIFRELASFYAARKTNAEPQLPELEIQYADYAEWQQDWLTGDELGRQTDYWAEQLSGAPQLLELQTDRPRPRVQTSNGANVERNLDPQLSEQLRQLAQAQSCTLFHLLLTAFDVLLGRYTGNDKVVIGTPIAGRDRPELENLIGFFVNTLTMSADLSGNPRFSDLLGKVRQDAIDAFAHSELPFEKLVEILQPERDTSYTPVFQVMFVMQHAMGGNTSFADLEATTVSFDPGMAKFDISLFVTDSPDSLSLLFNYNTDLFDAVTAERMATHFDTLLNAIAAAPDTPIEAFSLLDDSERQTLLTDWNSTAMDYDHSATIHSLFEQQAAAQPDNIAVWCDGATLSYGELNRRANILAQHLQTLGVDIETLIGISIERSLDMIVAQFGIMKAGGAYVPLDPNYPADRVRFMLEDSAAPVLLTQTPVLERLPRTDAKLVCLDTFNWGESDPGNPQSSVTPNNLGYVIYTSGSTGKPKGVMIEHGNAVALIKWAESVFSSDEWAGVLASTSVCFDLSVFEIFCTLGLGGRIVVVQDALALPALPPEADVRLINTVPSAIAELLRSGDVPASVKTVNLAGEPLTAALVNDIYALGTVERVNDLYGPSEDTTYSTWTRRETNAVASIGRPIANTRVYLLDQHMQPTPTGVPGELCLAGDGLTRGYLNRPELTAEKYIQDPFGAAGEKLYRTGDLARYRHDGTLEYIGRLDHQVKLRGFRIELGEIETTLEEHPSIATARVIIREDTPGDKWLVAYVVATTECAIDIADLRSHIQTTLPSYMIPQAFVLLDEIPLTPNGKLDRKALPAPDGSALARAEYVAPRNEREEQLATIWAELLHAERIGIHDDFFELGGHSLLATQLVARIRDRLNAELPLLALFNNPTVASLAEHLDKDATTPTTAPINVVERDAPLPLSFAQQRLWLIDQLEPGSSAYNFPLALELMGSLQRAALESAINDLIARHETLRTRFAVTQADGLDTPLQIIAPALHIAIENVDCTGQDVAATQATMTALSQQPFDLKTGPLLRVHLLQLAADKHVALLIAHHIIADGWSLHIMVNELRHFYAARCDGHDAQLDALPVQYGDYAVWQRNWLDSPELGKQLDYWRAQLDDAAPLLELPTDRPRPAEQSYHGDSKLRWLPMHLAEQLKQLSQQRGCTLYMTLLAAFDVLLARYSNSPDIIVGTPIAGRGHTELEGLIGFLTNTLALRSNLEGDPDFGTLLQQVKQTTLDAYSNQDVPFEKLVEEIQPERALSHSPIFQVLFALQNTPEADTIESFGELTARTIGFEMGIAKFDLLLEIAETPEGLRTGLQFNIDLFDASTIERMLDHFEILLGAIVAQPDAAISKLPLMGDAERQHVLTDFNATAMDVSEDTVHGLVELQAARTPEAIALVMADKALSYKELNSRANRLARALVNNGAGAGSLVGISCKRSIEMAVAVLATLKSGAAYVPIDPNYPADRIAYMLDDSQAPVLLTQSQLIEQLPATTATILAVDQFDWTAGDNSNLDGGGESVYAIYTSGSTGKPKGVELTHAGLSNLIQWQSAQPGLSEPARTLQFASLSFDVSFQELFSTWAQGGTVVLIDDELRRDLPQLAKFIATADIERVYLPYAALQPLADSVSSSGLNYKVRDVIVAGEQLQVTPSIKKMFSVLANARLHNHYGPSETHVTTAFTLTGDPEQWMALPPIGTPVANTQAYVLDTNCDPVPIGVPGELYLAGRQIAKGYIHQPELTAEKFLPDPFTAGEDADQRMYKTGDRVRFLADGNIEYLGRTDDQVKWRGFRIEPGEIEARLAEHVDVQQAVVLLREDTPGDKRLVAYLIAAPEHTLDTISVKTWLKDQLPDYMVPSTLMVLDKMPLTPSGKVARRKLPQPDYADAVEAYVAPSTPTEEILVTIWADVLNVPRVGVHDDFFELGGHSLLATQLISRLRDALDVELPLKYVFRNTTAARLAQAIETLQLATQMTPADDDDDEDLEEFQI